MIEIATEEEVRDLLGIKQVDNGSIENKILDKKPLVQIKRLPSNFKGYPEGTVISYEPLTLGELEALNNSDEVDVERGFAMLLNAIHCNTLPAHELYYWDVIYIGIQRKLLAFGDTHGVLYEQCPKCGNIIEREFDYTKLDFKEIEAPALPIITKIQDTEVEISVLSMKDFLELDLDKGEIDVYARMIKNLPYEDAYDLVYNCYGKDSKKIRYIDKMLNYGIKPFIEECDGEIPNPDFDETKKSSKKNPEKIPCNEKVRLEVRSPFEVVFPEDTNNGFDESEIQYGRK